MPYPMLFITAASTTSTNTIASVVLTLAALGAVVGACTCYSASAEEARDKENAREEARRARYEHDRYIRDHVESTAQLVSSATPPLIAELQNSQRQFSELVTELAHSINQGEQGNAALQNLIPLMMSQLSQLTTLTSKFGSELPNSHQQLTSLTSQLSVASGEFNQNQENLSQAVKDIGEASSQLRRAADLLQNSHATDSADAMTLLKQQKRHYKMYIDKLTERVEEQSRIIKALEAKLVEKPCSPKRVQQDPRVFKRLYKGIVPLDSLTHLSSNSIRINHG